MTYLKYVGWHQGIDELQVIISRFADTKCYVACLDTSLVSTYDIDLETDFGCSFCKFNKIKIMNSEI